MAWDGLRNARLREFRIVGIIDVNSVLSLTLSGRRTGLIGVALQRGMVSRSWTAAIPAWAKDVHEHLTLPYAVAYV